MIGQYSENDRIWVETGDVAVPIGKRRFPTWQISSRPASPEDGEFGLNTETDAIEVYDDADSEWKTYKQNSDSDHGELQGLSDDDHSQYLLLAGRGGQTIDDTITINDDLWVNNNNANSKVFLGALPSTPATYSGLWFGQSTPVDNNYTFLASNQNAFLNVPSGGLLEIRVGNSTTPGSGQMARIGDFGGGNYCFDITDRLYVTTNNSSWAAAVIEQDYDAAGNSIILDLRNSTQVMIAGVYSDGRALFPTQSFPATVGDKVSLYDNYLGTASNYGYGVEPNYLYFKAGSGIGGFRWYINANADGGTSDYMELSVYGLTVNRPTTIKGNLFLHSDNDEILLGAGKDVGISYDGTDMKIVTNKVNASDLVIDCGTDKTVELTETVYEDLRTPLAQARVPAVAAPDWAKFKDDGAGSTGVYAWHFDPNSVEQLYFTIQFPHSIKEGADVYPHIHWCPTDSNTGNVVWAIEYTWQDINGTFGNTSTTTVTAAADGTAYKHQVASFGAFTGKNISSIVVCRIYRDATNPNDTYPSDAVALEFDCHYQVNTLGSRQEFTK